MQATSQKTSQFIDWISPLAKKDGVEFDCHIYHTDSTDILFQQNALKNYSASTSQNFILRVLKGDKSGVSYTKNLKKESIKECYQQAMYSLTFSDKKQRGELSPSATYKDLSSDIYNDSISKIPLTEKIKKTQTMSQGAISFDKKIQPAHAETSDRATVVNFGNSNHHQGSYRLNGVLAFSHSLAVDKQRRSQGMVLQTAKSYDGINFKTLGERSAKKSLQKLSFVLPKTGKYPVIFNSAYASPTLVSLLLQHISGKTVYEKRSLLANRLNQQVFSDQLTLNDDPFAPWGWNTRPFDGEGFPSQKTTVVKQGVLKNYFTHSFFAKALNVSHTAHAVWSKQDNLTDTELHASASNIIMEEGNHSFEDLLNEFPKGIIIDELKGLAGYNATSGNFSIESEGFLWTNHINHRTALCEFTVSGNIIDVFSNILKVGNDSVIYNGSIKAPSFLIPELSIAGQ